MRKIGFFGGTFDPVHNGHIHIALSLLERYGLDEIMVCPAYLSPHKVEAPPVATPSERLKMVEFIVKDLPRFTLCTDEMEREGPSFTVDTLRKIAAEKRGELCLLITEDALATLHLWKGIEELLTLARPLVGSRGGVALPLLPRLSLEAQKKIAKGWTVIPEMGISGTELRQRLKEGLYCGHLIPPKVLDFIHENEIYSK